MEKLALLNTSILTAPGRYELENVTLEDAKTLMQTYGSNIDSAIGHQSTADIMTTLLGIDVPLNRQMFAQAVGQEALVFKLNGRPPEGTILTEEDILKIGYKFQVLRRLS